MIVGQRPIGSPGICVDLGRGCCMRLDEALKLVLARGSHDLGKDFAGGAILRGLR